MAKQDVIDNWSDGKAGTFTYKNGETVDYTVSMHSAYSLDYSVNGIVSGVNLKSSVTPGHHSDFVEVSFDSPVSEVTFAITEMDGANEEQIVFTVDGNIVNLRELIASGDVTISGPFELEGISATNSAGQVEYDDETAVIYVTFHQALSTIRLDETTTSSEGALLVDLLLDTSYPPSYVPPCFTAGTLIDTDKGQVPVETLQVGDLIRTKDHGFQPVKWVSESRVFASGFDVPLRIKKGTFDNTRDLVVSPRHRMLLQGWELDLMFNHEEAFATAKDLRNDETIVREPEGWVTYYHVLLPQHEVIYAEGAATESFYPDEGTLAGMAVKTKEELLNNFTPETYGPPARLTFDPMRAMWVGRNLDILNGDDMGQIAAYENAMKAAQ